MLCVPAASDAIEKVAVPFDRDDVPKDVEPSSRVTFPEGVEPDAAVTVTLKATFCPAVICAVEAETVVLVAMTVVALGCTTNKTAE